MLLAVHYRVMEHVGSLESTQEARVARGDSTLKCTLKHEPIVKMEIYFRFVTLAKSFRRARAIFLSPCKYCNLLVVLVLE